MTVIEVQVQHMLILLELKKYTLLRAVYLDEYMKKMTFNDNT